MTTSIEIIEFEDEDGGGIGSWWADGHHEPEDFAKALADHWLDYGEDPWPQLDFDRIKQHYMRKAHDEIEGRWTAYFESEKNRWNEPVTTFDSYRRYRGKSCVVSGCKATANSCQPISAILTADDEERFSVGLSLCKEHSVQMPQPSYRISLIPVGATIQLPPEATS